MQCQIFKSQRKADTYVYFEKPADEERLPTNIRNMLGNLEFVMDLELDESRKLARANPLEVIENINRHGFHLQLPRQEHEINTVISGKKSSSAQ